MHSPIFRLVMPIVGALALAACQDSSDVIAGPDPVLATAQGAGGGSGGTGGHDTAVGNNLSFPVIWAEGDTKVLRGTPGVVKTEGWWWWWWGTKPDGSPLACAPDPDDQSRCNDGVAGISKGYNPLLQSPATARKAYLQKDPLNEWQAGSIIPTAMVRVDSVDWGDNLEARDWNLFARVRIETVLIDNLAAPLTEYVMRHTWGTGINEAHGLSVIPTGSLVESLPSSRATVYSSCGRLTIQKLNVARETVQPGNLVWDKVAHRWNGSKIRAPIFNLAVHQAGDGPGWYNAEINVKGKIIYGYTWNVQSLNEGAGDYRVTFSLDLACGAKKRNTLIDINTVLVQKLEDEGGGGEASIMAEPVKGATAVLDYRNHLTYLDVRILPNRGGGM
jgi:hypothetical protein